MDTSETYIKMCEKAEEIQPHLGENAGVGGTWLGGSILYHLALMNQPHDRDGFYHITDTETIRRCETCGHEEPYISSTKAIWLPRQDQLQAMSELTWIEFDNKCRVYWRGQTKEQASIQVVMKENHGKVWDGTDWGEVA